MSYIHIGCVYTYSPGQVTQVEGLVNAYRQPDGAHILTRERVPIKCLKDLGCTSRNGHVAGGGGSSSGTAVFPKKQPSIVGKVSSTLFEEDPGIMSEAETASTSSHLRKSHRHQHHHHNISTSDPRKGSSSDLPVVRTPSKTLEKPLGIVFLIFRGETKRALLPNEITSIITVKALFVREGISVEVCTLLFHQVTKPLINDICIEWLK